METLQIPPKESQSSPQIQEFQPEPLADNFLKNVPDIDRIVVSKYVTEWDKAVNERFRAKHDELKPYKDLGPVEDIQAALSFIGEMNEDLPGFFNNLREYLKEEGMLTDDEVDKVVDEAKGVAKEFEGIPKEFLDEFNQMKAQLADVTSFKQFREEEDQNASIQAELDNLYQQMHTDFGDFDEDVMTAWLAKGMTPKAAIEKWQGLETKLKGSATPTKKDPQAPRVFTGPNGSVPQEQGKVTFKNSAERKAYAVQALINSQGE